MEAAYNIGPEVTVDEAIIPYMPAKPVKWGMQAKAWLLSDTATGYVGKLIPV